MLITVPFLFILLEAVLIRKEDPEDGDTFSLFTTDLEMLKGTSFTSVQRKSDKSY